MSLGKERQCWHRIRRLNSYQEPGMEGEKFFATDKLRNPNVQT